MVLKEKNQWIMLLWQNKGRIIYNSIIANNYYYVIFITHKKQSNQIRKNNKYTLIRYIVTFRSILKLKHKQVVTKQELFYYFIIDPCRRKNSK